MTTKRMPAAVAGVVMGRAGGMCEAWLPGVCTTRVEHLHHRKLRSRGGNHTVENLIGICHACHGYIHANVAESTDLGLIVSTYADPAVVHVVRRGMRALLHTDGSVETEVPPWTRC